MAITKGIDHVGLSVKNLEESINFFQSILEFDLSKYVEGKYAFVTDGFRMITLWQTAKSNFDIHTAGLHHLAFQVETAEDLYKVEKKLKENNYRIQFDGVGVRGEEGDFLALYFYDPSGIRIELVSNELDEIGRIPIIGGCGAID
ncbi:VOC family protein [Bacillus subtilis]|uniref:VOC family protein n=1 Tax=Bacillus subtilis TaxID=1423 RepID=A0AAP2LYT9_BACIU|nr:VOC family protein [Bacillus subtilis]ASZ60047.1 glyoxalase [Bacillus subtilis]MBO3767636.1 VOC family protein [Bacillus subtilis]MCB4339148.1 Metallothiol transferase FosB [Bacillus subtilis]ODV44772.1 hypothetical protein BCM26_03210 [Bacillus subtilis]OJH64743.1 hypothetical protein BOH71_03225 [Bacillus subtilis]